MEMDEVVDEAAKNLPPWLQKKKDGKGSGDTKKSKGNKPSGKGFKKGAKK